MRELLAQERRFALKPIGIKYICEFCNEGEMKFDTSDVTIIPLNTDNSLRKHRCTKCNKEMLLPTIYPYIEWITEEEEECK